MPLVEWALQSSMLARADAPTECSMWHDEQPYRIWADHRVYLEQERTWKCVAAFRFRREVFVKTMKGQTMVRKLLLWATRKEAKSGWPAYVATCTDFSPGRQEPLQRELRVSSSAEQIETLYAELKKEKVVKGWTAT